MTHYFTNNVDLKSKKEKIIFHYHQHNVYLFGDNGVFSKGQVDYGTRVLLDTIHLTTKHHSVLDVGCGYGAIGLSLKVAYPWINVDMVDVNLRALELTKEAIIENGLENVNCFESNVYENVKKCYDVIVTNPPIRAGKKVVFDILEKAYHHLNDGGELYVVIQKKQGAPSALKKMEEVFENCEILKRDKGYYILKSIK